MIETARLVLRVPEARDRAALHGMWADPRVMIDLGPVKDAAASDTALARHDSYRGDGLGFWSVIRREDDAVVGFCGLKPGSPDTPIADMLEVGWMLAVPYWRQGYAAEAAAASIRWGWDNRPDEQIVAVTARQNEKSRVLMTRLGMRHMPSMDFAHPLFPEGDSRRDSVTYVIDRPA